MTMGFDVRAEQMETIAGVIHPADGSARPQILAKSDNAEYHELISNFKKLTGVGCLLNTLARRVLNIASLRYVDDFFAAERYAILKSCVSQTLSFQHLQGRLHLSMHLVA